MKASYNWLKEFVDIPVPPKELAHVLTMSGFEVEAIEEYEGDTVFDIGVTPNRPDCLSIRGLARETAAILETPFRDVHADISARESSCPEIEVADSGLCSRYASRLVLDVRPGHSPEWLSKRLECHGIRSTSNIVDITNYVLLEFGQPLHAFDLDRLGGRKIRVKRAGSTRSFTTLDDEERSLHEDMLLIWDASKPVAIAGVMGGKNTEVSESTRNVLLESAYFKPASVRRTSKSLNLSTESSYRFERGIDINGVTSALNRAAQLISEIAGGRVSEMTDIYPELFKPRKIHITFEKINATIGTDIEEPFVQRKLEQLGCAVERAGQGIAVTPPGYRNDVERDVDIIEEIARLYGYDNIPSTLPLMQMSPSPEHHTRERIKAVKDCMVKAGFTEAINFSFLNPESLERLNIPEEDRRRGMVFIRNPLRREDESLRTTLLPALLHNVSLNLNRGEKMIRFFEVSKVFLPSSEKLPDEVIQLAAVYHKDMGTMIWQDRHDGFYDVKGALENLCAYMKISDYSFEQEAVDCEPYLHPGKSCSVLVGGVKVGSAGTLHPAVSEAFDIKGNINILEIYNLETLFTFMKTKTTFSPLPKYPYVERDLSLVVADDVTVSSVKREILDADSGIIEAVTLFDVYKGKPIPKDRKSIAFSIRFRSNERTLNDSEVDELHSRIIKRLEANLKAELRS